MNASNPFTNDLSKETSPYLLQHAHNPVNWMPWSEHIFTMAAAQQKPILLSIGYAACHWCHVMERESFEDESVAAIMNTHFINVKVDREERPDIDHIYMDALQAMTGSGGWPLNIFLLPNGQPFFGGTYFPPTSIPNRASWVEVLKGVYTAFEKNKEKLIQQADQLTNHLLQSNSQLSLEEVSMDFETIATPEEVALISTRILHTADTAWGGFGAAPKFPQTGSIQMLLRNYKLNANESSMVHAIRSLDKMIQGGIYDQLGGGFARYSTDAQWQAPHFEKMLYDNALLIGVISEAYQITQKNTYAFTINQTIDFLKRELCNNQGAFYASLDADSEGVEGKFYTWTYEEIKNLIDPEIFDSFCAYYQIEKEGNWEHTNILWTQDALENGLSTEFLKAKKVLFEYRALRIRPAMDNKIILSWNNLMVIALCKAYAALGNQEYKQMAITTMQWIEDNLYNKSENHFYHTSTNGIKKSFAFLEDYATLIQAYIHLQEITGDLHYLIKAKTWTNYVLAQFMDEEGSFFYFTPVYQKDIILRKKETYDGAQPSANAMMCMNLFYLGYAFDQSNWKLQSEQMIKQMRKKLLQYPNSFSYWAMCFYMMSGGLTELVAVGPTIENARNAVLNKFSPQKILLFTLEESPHLSMTLGKKSVDNQYFICKDKTCLPSFSDLSSILALI